MARNKKRKKRVLNLAIVFTLSAVVLGSATYAWFIGMRTVSVNPFEVEIAATESLQLSLDGKTWSDTVSINSTNYSSVYTGNTNSWGGRGLIPVSSVGDIDATSNRLKLYEKGSLTSTTGGYRLMASQVDNSTSETDGYVAFDLFIKNSSGSQYYDTYNVLNEEAIYLSTNSEVKVASTGVANTGIENSVRVAFAQIGRVVGTTTDETEIQGITCNGAIGTKTGNVTSICRTAQIWEPNDTSHVADALTWYNTTCKARKSTGTDTSSAASYEGACGTVVDGQAYPTYAIRKAIDATTAVDVYDGTAYNGYTANTTGDSSYLYEFPSFTDTDKFKTGVERPTFMTLAPNSITKVRVYIYIEGQDIDNYDFASIGKKIAVNFGFTKERFTEDDINYTGPVLNEGDGPEADDKTVPVIKLKGQQVMTLTKGTAYEEPGVESVTDNVSTLNAEDVQISGTVNKDVVGSYRVLYKIADAAGNIATEVRTINVVEAGAGE